jgi:hypothetical protein
LPLVDDRRHLLDGVVVPVPLGTKSEKVRRQSAQARAEFKLPGRYPGKSWATGEMMVPEEALGFLAHEGVRFTVEGPATYEQIASLRVPVATEVQ